MSDVTIIDYGMGNIGSVHNALNLLGAEVAIAETPQQVEKAKAIILPGVGAFEAAMINMHQSGLIDVLSYQVRERKTPFLGICLGLQLLAHDSEEQSGVAGLGWLDGHVTRLQGDERQFPVPHVGWNNIHYEAGNPLFSNMEEQPHFFFDHSFQLSCSEQIITSRTDYSNSIVASIQHENIYAVQFHPEKSQRNGLKLLRNFLNLSAIDG